MCLLLNNSAVDALVHAVDHDGEKEAEDGPDVLEVDPVVHKSVVLVQVVAFWVIAEFGFVHDSDKPSNVDGETNSNKVVHFEEKTEGTLLHLVDLGEKFNELVHALHAKIDKHEPVDVLHVCCRVFVVR